ncbi:MAG: class I SAM-dependent methyltransferase, partial [Desulfosarcinaceae bacterium]
LGGKEPAGILRHYWRLAIPGTALDIACGNGRNSVFLCRKGFNVDAVDLSKVATDHLRGRRPQLNAICADLDTWEIPPERYDLIINIRFLDRRLFPAILAGLKPGGVVIFESYLAEGPDAYRLKYNELLRAFASLRVVYYEERKTAHAGKFDQIASLVAVKPTGGAPLPKQ